MKDIWMYWENAGKTRPEYINLCIQSIMTHKGDLRLNLLDQNTINQYLPDLRPEWHRLKKAAHKADYIRTRLVYTYGGLWVDCDMAALKSIEPLFDFPDAYDYACQDVGQSIGCFVARPGCELLKNVIAAQDKVLDKNFIDFQWNGIGNELLTEYGKGYPYYQWPKWTLDEIPGNALAKLLSSHETFEKNIDANAVIFHFCNESIGPLIQKHVKNNRLLTSDKLISKIFRKALQIDESIVDEGFNFFPFLRRILRQS